MSAILLQYLGMLKTFQVCNALCNLQGRGYIYEALRAKISDRAQQEKKNHLL